MMTLAKEMKPSPMHLPVHPMDLTTSQSLDFENEEKAIQGVIGKWDPGTPELDLENARFARHRVSRCIHVMQDESESHFKCGRRMAATYLVLDEKPSFMHPLCNTCFRPEG